MCVRGVYRCVCVCLCEGCGCMCVCVREREREVCVHVRVCVGFAPPADGRVLRAAEKIAKDGRARVWKDYVPTAIAGDREYAGKVCACVLCVCLCV